MRQPDSSDVQMAQFILNFLKKINKVKKVTLIKNGVGQRNLFREVRQQTSVHGCKSTLACELSDVYVQIIC